MAGSRDTEQSSGAVHRRGRAAALVAVAAAVVTTVAVLVLVCDPEPDLPAPAVEADAQSATLAPGPTTTALAAVDGAAPTTAPSSLPAPPGTGDLGLSRPITTPSCAGMVVVVGSATDPGRAATTVQRLLTAFPGSEYLRAGDACPPLREQLAGAEYAVYLGPFTTRELACDARMSLGVSSPVVALDAPPGPGSLIAC